MADYDLAEAFKAIENELIASMIRNLSHHQKEEAEQEMNWTQWQVEQLNALEKYRKNNQNKFSKQFENINGRITQLIRDYYSDGETEQERKILQAIKRGYKINGTNKPAFTGKTRTTAEFFGLNDRKLEALITATTHDMQRAETAVLRLANDQYRKAIFNAQVYANAGGTTYKKAVDMAVKDMLNAGLNCVEYKNGARHTLEDYASMAIRTATTRAYLQGEGTKRNEWGISTVILNKRSCPCAKCLPFVGKVFIDDVWSGGTKEEAKEKGYPLLSTAIEQGLYHPNCKDTHTTYFEGISTPPQKPTAEEKQQAVDEYNQEQKARYNAQQAEKCERISKYSLDEENKRVYKARAEQWRDKEKSYKQKEKVHKLSDTDNMPNDKNNTDTLSKTAIAKNNSSGIINYEYEPSVKPDVRKAFDETLNAMIEKFGNISTIKQVGVLKGGNDYGEYYDYGSILNIAFANSKDCLKKHAQKAVEMKKAGKWSTSHPYHTFRHEIAHAIQAEYAINDPLWESKLNKIREIMKSLPEFQKGFKGTYSVSSYAMKDLDEFISECIAESMTKKARGTAKKVVNVILGVD